MTTARYHIYEEVDGRWKLVNWLYSTSETEVLAKFRSIYPAYKDSKLKAECRGSDG